MQAKAAKEAAAGAAPASKKASTASYGTVQKVDARAERIAARAAAGDEAPKLFGIN